VPVASAGTATCAGLSATIVGTAEDDVLVGTAQRDIIQGGQGRDRISALAGNDVLCGGETKDFLSGGSGDDRIFGGLDSRYIGDSLRGGAGADLLVGGSGPWADRLLYAEARRGVDVDLTAGRATGQGRDVLAGIERVVGSPYADRMAGRSSDLAPEVDADLRLYGRAGSYVFRGNGRMYGGDGPDIFRAFDGMTAYGVEGADVMTFVPPERQPPPKRKYSASFQGGPGADSMDMTGMQKGDAAPGPGDDAVTGTPGRDRVSLSAGDDTVITGGGSDLVGAGFGADRVWTGSGDDEVTIYCGTAYLRAGRGKTWSSPGDFTPFTATSPAMTCCSVP
jgi:Ca2+-binding RTX toxin-like protein